ncbi:hypothetical protein PG994_001638 [Apiospora phragmitis]|uniref:YDG domain-containing protein n=1 Tax=Apiospora phragmitis TaxID=2905665 RepID=A0ABR1WU14_9PEZI
MVNQLKRKRIGSLVAPTKRLPDRGPAGRTASMVNELAGTEKALVATQPETAGTVLVGSGPEETENEDDVEKAASSYSDTEYVLQILDIPTAPHDHYGCLKGMQEEHRGIRSFAIPTSDPEDVRRLERLTPYLNFLELRLEMNHRIFKESKVAASLALMNTPGFHFPANVAEHAARLVAKWEDQDWSEDITESEDQPVAQQQASNAASNNANEEAPAVQFSVPSARDPLFGTTGIMHGVILTRNHAGRRVYMLKPRLLHQSSKEFGHNGLSVGQWFPMRLAALHHGAHRASQAGIYGSQKTGAFSIVAGNSTYHEFDQDTGDTLYYSAPRAHENKDPNQVAPASSGSLALRSSSSSRNPVRVLRAAGGGSNKWLPRCGLRYDGLYRVDTVREKKNASGGLYEQFKLVRLGPNING